MRGTSGWGVLVGVTCTLAAPQSLLAQGTATVDVGVSSLRYDGFLPSGAAAVSPALRWDRPQLHLVARGTYLHFESGSHSLQGFFTGSVLTPATRPVRGELGITTGASSYAEFAGFWHALGEGRVLLSGTERGGWIGAGAGRTSFGGAPRPIARAAMGAWARASWITLVATASHSWIGDTVYTDVESNARGRRGPLLLVGSLGARLWSRGGGHGVYGEASATYDLNQRTALVLSGGRYPTDPLRGSISGRYVTLAIRLNAWQPRRAALPDPPLRTGASHSSSTEALRLEVLRRENGAIQLTVHAPDANRVEIAGDFTDWQPVALSRAASGTWSVALSIATGVHRMNIRVDGGRWTVPEGTTRTTDDFGSDVGIFVVP